MSSIHRLGMYAASGIAVLALGAAGCGGGDSGKKADETPSQTTSSATLNATDSKDLGTIVTDSKGFTLYRFDKDTASPSKSNCSGSCAALWPPATAKGSATLKGIDKSLVGTVNRSDGSKQLTLNGWPLYRYTPDSKPGDTKGQDVDDTWHASTPQGKKAQGESSDEGGTTGGY